MNSKKDKFFGEDESEFVVKKFDTAGSVFDEKFFEEFIKKQQDMIANSFRIETLGFIHDSVLVEVSPVAGNSPKDLIQKLVKLKREEELKKEEMLNGPIVETKVEMLVGVEAVSVRSLDQSEVLLSGGRPPKDGRVPEGTERVQEIRADVSDTGVGTILVTTTGRFR